MKVLGQGNGGLSEFYDRLPEDEVVYAVLGIKFCFFENNSSAKQLKGQNVEDQDESGYAHLKYIFITWVKQAFVS